ncbi:MAG TPA: STAS/SEC14 domain-containing protein [Polyangiaceae bacterium]|nr:STAS/SEC14 domain-containing protein [Polyangiaceae bacterium]
MPNSDSLRFDIVGHVMVIVHADTPPSDADWARMVVVRNASHERIRSTLVVAPPRASINASQRADVAQHMKETGASIAVVTDSALVRGVARAVGLLGLRVRAFAPGELASALDYLAVPQSRHAEMIRRIDAMKTQLRGSASS